MYSFNCQVVSIARSVSLPVAHVEPIFQTVSSYFSLDQDSEQDGHTNGLYLYFSQMSRSPKSSSLEEI